MRCVGSATASINRVVWCPIYIGDDLTDEDAFDAIRYTGVGIVVRNDEDGGRATAAQFTLHGPGEVVDVSPPRRDLAGIREAELGRHVDGHVRGL